MRKSLTTGLHSTNCGSSHVPHVRCKPEGIRPRGTWWRVCGVQPTQTVSKHTRIHKQTFKNSSLTSGDSVRINFLFIYIQSIQNFSLSSVFLLVNPLVAEQPDATLAYSATLITLPVCCHCSRWSSCCLPSGTFFLTLINS